MGKKAEKRSLITISKKIWWGEGWGHLFAWSHATECLHWKYVDLIWFVGLSDCSS